MCEERKLVVFIAASLDGYIATTDENLDFLYHVEGEGDNGYSLFYETVDTVILGRKTYDWLLKNVEGDFPYKGKTCYVFSREFEGQTEHVIFVNDDVEEFTKSLKKESGKSIYLVGGSDLLHSFLHKRMIDDIVLTLSPSLIGKGIPLFRETDDPLDLHLVDMKRYNQFVQLHYQLKKIN